LALSGVTTQPNPVAHPRTIDRRMIGPPPSASVRSATETR